MKHVRKASRSGTRQRGAVMVETAIVVSAMMTLMLGMVELGVVGFEQLTLDAAGFLNAHQTVIGVKDASGPNDATSQVFPNVKPGSYLGTTVVTAPSPNIPVDYGYNGTAAEQAVASVSHVGGASVVQPYVLQTNLKQTLFTFLGFSLNVSSTASEPEYLETDLDYGVSNLNYGQNNSNPLYRSNLFTNGEETPPFFAVWANYQECNDSPPWVLLSCPSLLSFLDPLLPFPALQTTREDSAGLGVFLDTNNWGMGGSGVPGISGPACATYGTVPCATTGPFEPAACHQRVYSALATFVSQYPDLNAIETIYDPMLWNAVTKNNIVFYGQNLAFRTLIPMPDNFAANIEEVYGWDLASLNTYTGVSQGANLLHPTAGCT